MADDDDQPQPTDTLKAIKSLDDIASYSTPSTAKVERVAQSLASAFSRMTAMEKAFQGLTPAFSKMTAMEKAFQGLTPAFS